jgi:Tfp pilus assembly protein PilO
VRLAAEVFAVVLLVLPIVVVGYFFVWAARKDGEEDRALQKRLGIRRKTRLGR